MSRHVMRTHVLQTVMKEFVQNELDTTHHGLREVTLLCDLTVQWAKSDSISLHKSGQCDMNLLR